MTTVSVLLLFVPKWPCRQRAWSRLCVLFWDYVSSNQTTKETNLSRYGESDTVEEEPVNDLEDIELDELEDDD